MVNWREIDGERVLVLDEDSGAGASLLGKGHIEAEKFCRIARQVRRESAGPEYDREYDPADIYYSIGRFVPGEWVGFPEFTFMWYPSEPGRGAFEGTQIDL